MTTLLAPWPFPHKWHDKDRITTLLATCDLSNMSGMVWPLLPYMYYWHCVMFPTIVARYGLITTLLVLCDLSHLSGMIRPVWPHYWHRVTFPTLVAWYGQYYHINWHCVTFPMLVAWYGQYYHITGTVWHFKHLWHDTVSITTLLPPCDHSHITGTVWHFPQ